MIIDVDEKGDDAVPEEGPIAVTCTSDDDVRGGGSDT